MPVGTAAKGRAGDIGIYRDSANSAPIDVGCHFFRVTSP